MKILLCSIGSRGDIQPFFVLGDYLTKHGHDVRVASANMYAESAENYDFEYHAFEGDYKSIINDEAMQELVGKNPLTLRKNLQEKVYPIIQSSIQKFYELSGWADVIVYHPKSLVDCFAQDIQHKLIKAYVIPAFSPTKEFKNPLLEFLPLPKFLYKFTYKLVLALLGTVKTPINNFRKENNLPNTPLHLDTPIIYGISPLVIDQPKDYPSGHSYTGFWLKETKEAALDQSILDFVHGKKEILIITFGSMPYKSKININDFIKAIRKEYDLKIIIVKAWGLKDVAIHQDENILAIDRAPFDLLFPLADYVVHHGGAGTIATAVKAGIPQMICPVLHPVGDQYFWGKVLERKGLGARPVPLKKLTVKKLLKGIETIKNASIKSNTVKMQEAIKDEDGLANALRIIEDHGAKF